MEISQESLSGDVFDSPEIPGLQIKVERAVGEKCARCWKWYAAMKAHARYPQACSRCVGILDALEA
jgi:isoleucyl-tRNA synthetase